jgi:hypothetical protein
MMPGNLKEDFWHFEIFSSNKKAKTKKSIKVLKQQK